MFKESFVSLSFSSDKLQVLRLNSAKTKVVKLASIGLPKGQIENFRVQDKIALAQTLKNVWAKLGLKEKAVVIVVPEFSTFTQLLLLPKLDYDELDEAVRWQAQDFLPAKPEDMVMDWKIVKKQDGGFQILAVAMDKEILKGYVDSAVLAGLFPLAVETPSLSLVRISNQAPTGKLILYNNFGEGILIIAQGEKIFGSSVVPFDNHDEVVRTAGKIVGHYKGVKVEKILIGGPGVGKELLARLEKELGRKVEWIKPSLQGLSEKDIQEYLIPISLQRKELAAPSDENTVNLLPVELVKRYENAKLKHQAWSLTLLVTLIVWFSFLSTLGFFLFMAQEIKSMKAASVTQRISPEKAEIINRIGEINTISDKVIKIVSASVPPQVVFNAVSRAKPVGVTLLGYKVDLERGKILLSGISSDRQTLIDFKQNLEEIDDFSLVQIPLSSLESVRDLNFTLAFTYLPAVSKKTK
jgi:hypothetical protein